VIHPPSEPPSPGGRPVQALQPDLGLVRVADAPRLVAGELVTSVTPEWVAAVVRSVLRDLLPPGARTLPNGRPTAVVVAAEVARRMTRDLAP
jgi:hypothetical protein